MGATKRIKPRRLAEKLKRIRVDLGLTLDELAEKLSNPDITLYRGTIHNYEGGDREPPLPVLLNYARLANVYLETLVDDEIDLPEKIPSRQKSEGVKLRTS